MADEHLPFHLEAVVIRVARHLAPGYEEIDLWWHVRFPHRARRVHPRLAEAFLQARDRRPERSVDVEGDEIVAAHTRAPRAVDVGDDAIRELEGGVGGVIHIGLVGLAVLVPALRDVGRAEAGDAFDFAEQIVEHVAPVTEHVEDDAAAVLLAIIPRRTLRRLPVAFEHPVPEFAAYR